jgi:ribose transport system permease protein
MKQALFNIMTGHQSRQGLWALPLLMALAIILFLTVRTDHMLRPDNLFNLLAQAMPLIITAVGQMFVVLVGGLDLSVGSVISFTTAILALGGPAYILIPAVFLLAALIGFTNGIAVARLNVHPIIATLAMQYIILGVTLVLRPVAGGSVPRIVIDSVSGTFLGVPMQVCWVVVTILIAWKLLYRSRYGLHLFAIGGGVASGMEDAARNVGIRVRRNVILAYVASACFAAAAGIFLAGRIVSGDPAVGNGYELNAITAVAIGGTQLSGGIGSLHGTVIGAFVLALLSNGMTLLNVSPFVQTAIQGGILLLVVAVQTRRKMGL